MGKWENINMIMLFERIGEQTFTFRVHEVTLELRIVSISCIAV